jgi:hypothetical protein
VILVGALQEKNPHRKSRYAFDFEELEEEASEESTQSGVDDGQMSTHASGSADVGS